MRYSGWGVLALSLLFSPLGFLLVIILFVVLLLWYAAYLCCAHPWHIAVFIACPVVFAFIEFAFRKMKQGFTHLWVYYFLKSSTLILSTIIAYVVSVFCCFSSYTTEIDSLEVYEHSPYLEPADLSIIPNIYLGQDKYSFYYNMCLLAYNNDTSFEQIINNYQFRWHAFFNQGKLYRLLFYGNHPRNVGELMESLESAMDPGYGKVDRTTYDYTVFPVEFKVANKLMVDDLLSIHLRHNDAWIFVDSLQYNTVIDIKWQSLLMEDYKNLTDEWGFPL